MNILVTRKYISNILLVYYYFKLEIFMKNKRKSLSDEVFEKLKNDIVNVRYKQGEFITEAEVAHRFRISKTPAREALNRLNVEGFVESIPHKGYLVKSLSVNDILNLYQFRTILETASIELAILYASDKDLEQLEMMSSEKFIMNDEEDYRRCAEANYRFHMLIAKIGQNPLLVNALSYVLNQLRRMLFLDLKNINAEEISKDHQEIVRIIKRKDVDRAKELIKEHIKASQDRVFVYRMF